MDATAWMPKWQKELRSFKGIKSTFILEGNVSDEYPLFEKQGEQYTLTGFFPLNEIITTVFDSEETEGHYEFQYCDPVFGFSGKMNAELIRLYEKKAAERQERSKMFSIMDKLDHFRDTKIIRNSQIILTSMTNKVERQDGTAKSFVNVIEYASRFLASPDGIDTDEATFFLNLLYASNSAIRANKFINTMILIVNKLDDIPAWFFVNNPNVRTITISNPDRATRNAYVEQNYKIFENSASSESSKIQSKFVDLTEGMKLLELSELRRLYDKSNVAPEEIADVVAIYKYGLKENKWAQVKYKMDRLDGDMHNLIKRRVKGQDEALCRIVRVIKRAVVGLSGLQHSSNTKPKGILFLAGPTGTGKTEAVKAVTELLFEDEKTLLRFDMSEYTAEHSDQKLFGAPPGYAGYGSGGQLTNAVKNSPFSVLLFDEIEKAHPSIMDKFLQILEDGRMTDGQGKTVYFTETLIFFTSNVGVSEEIVHPATGKVMGRENIISPDEPYDVIQEKIEEAMKRHFKPEVINRIGENIVVFSYIDKESSEEIAKSQIESINSNLLKNNKIEINMSDGAYVFLFDLCWQKKTRSNGGRGIGNIIEEMYINPLAEYLFDNNCKENDVITVNTGDGKFVFAS